MCITEKYCSRCKTIKPVSEFGKYKDSPDGLTYWCKVCKSESRKESYKKNKEKTLATNRKWRSENKQRVSEKNKQWKQDNKESYSDKCKEYRKQNADKIKEYHKQWYESNKDIKNQQSKEWYERNKEYRRELDRLWRKRNLLSFREHLRLYRQVNKEKINQYSANYRANRNGATPLWLTASCFEEMSELYLAAQMFRSYTGEEYHVDHIVPLNSKLVCGLHVPWNLRVLPAKENLSKQNRYWPNMP